MRIHYTIYIFAEKLTNINIEHAAALRVGGNVYT